MPLTATPSFAVIGAVNMEVDITALKVAEDALRDQEERLRAILDTVNDAIITIDRRGGLAVLTFPGVECDVVVVSAGGHEDGAFAVSLGDLESEYIAIEPQRPLDVCDLQVEDSVGGNRYPAVGLLVRSRVVRQRFKSMLDDLLGQRTRGVVGAGGGS